MHRAAIGLAVLLGGALTAGVLLLTSRSVQSAPPAPSQRHSASEDILYIRIQTVTLHAPATAAIYTTTFTTTFQIHIRDYPLGSYIRLPTDAITRAAECWDNDSCRILPGQIDGSPVITYAGDGKATIYLEYDTCQRASRAPGSRLITVTYPIGPVNEVERISLTHVLVFSRSIHPFLELASATPEGYIYDAEEQQALRWEFTSTTRLTFAAAFTEPLLGADLVIERSSMSTLRPAPREPVRYTVTVRNVGPYATGRAVLAELFVRPLAYGAPTVLTDHIGGWSWWDSEQQKYVGYHENVLFKWYSGSVNTGNYWWAGLGPGEALTGTTVLTWPSGCEPCGVWAKVDPTYLDLGIAYEWWGYNPEGMECGKTEGLVPTCVEEANNIIAFIKSIYLPLVLRNFR